VGLRAPGLGLPLRETRRQGRIKPLAISNGASDTRTDRSRFRLDFDWNGTFDPSPWLTVPAAIDGLGEMLPGGWPSVIANNRQLMLNAREMLAAALHTDIQAPDEMTGPIGQPPAAGRSVAAA